MGREFIDLFNDWAESYDETVHGTNNEYHEVFEHYDEILNRVVENSSGTVLEFGVGTGNLSAKLLEKGRKVIGVEPSPAMRAKAQERFPELTLINGDFLSFRELDTKVDTIVSTYAFHHLTDDEKDVAIRNYGKLLGNNGKIVFADTVYEHEQAKQKIQERVEKQGYTNLLEDLQREYYTTIGVLSESFNAHGFEVSFERLNTYVWLIKAHKKAK
ncbi:class I SAM-dependent methyltransferase [Alkalihalobacillus sp. AL-G]|uniref:class I SAM-dependent DNA methyltransferase n=1 Tax=Alkalihalobacillus sp. AL-G TaxID=2926399 RepID=UPI00272CA08C|nr:class I SAM-dependent methyltransferase [Alkalihalobacillus sp. AL-G]WLD92181.1 class I SAM-dependent methyltransferase [Alkalihalobacillus sp. AL-G]